MNNALLTFICVLLTMLIEALGYFAFKPCLIKQGLNKRRQKNDREQKAREEE